MQFQKRKSAFFTILMCSSLTVFSASVVASDLKEDQPSALISPSLVNYLPFTEEEIKNAIDVSSHSAVVPSEQATAQFIEQEGLNLSAGVVRHAHGDTQNRIGLSIDGGGIRGVMPALWLNKLKIAYEEEGEEGIKAPLHEVFDYVGGTSIGGIVSLGVAAGLDTDTIVNVFENDHNRKRIFSAEGRKLVRFVDFFGLFGYRYASDNLEALMKETFGEDQTLSNLKTNILVTACTTEGHPWLFKKEDEADKNYRLWEVARSTSAAPTYFPAYKPQFPIQANRPELVDGGLWVNSPSTLVAASIVKELQDCKFDPSKLHILSLGTGDANGEAIPRSAGKLSAGAIIEALMSSHNRGNHMLMQQLLGENYHRVNAEMSHLIDLADVSDKAYGELKGYANQEQHNSKIKAFVDQTKGIIRSKLESMEFHSNEVESFTSFKDEREKTNIVQPNINLYEELGVGDITVNKKSISAEVAPIHLQSINEIDEFRLNTSSTTIQGNWKVSRLNISAPSSVLLQGNWEVSNMNIYNASSVIMNGNWNTNRLDIINSNSISIETLTVNNKSSEQLFSEKESNLIEQFIFVSASSNGKGWLNMKRAEDPFYGQWKTARGMTLASFKNNLYLAYTGLNKRVYLSSSQNNDTWEIVYEADKNFMSDYRPELIEFKDKFWMAFVSRDVPYLSFSIDGRKWENSFCPLGEIFKTKNAISLANFNEKLYLALVNLDGKIALSFSEDGKDWLQSYELKETWITFNPVSLCSFRDELYLSYISKSVKTKENNKILLTSSKDGREWSESYEPNINWRASSPVSLVNFKDKLYIAYCKPNSSEVCFAYTHSGINWEKTYSNSFNNPKLSDQLTLTSFQGNLFLAYTSRDKARTAQDLEHINHLIAQGKKYFKEKNYVKAEVVFLEAANQEDIQGQYYLAHLYHNQKNESLAKNYYKLAADRGHEYAQYSLAFLYKKQGKINYSKKYFELAAEQGNIEAAEALEKINKKYQSMRILSQQEIKNKWGEKFNKEPGHEELIKVFPSETATLNNYDIVAHESAHNILQFMSATDNKEKQPCLGLAIDGGGMGNLMPAVWLKMLQEEIGKTPLYKIFDCVGGTSSGSVLALSVAKGLDVGDLIRVFKEDIPNIFTTNNYLIKSIKQWFSSRYNPFQLEVTLKKIFGETSLSEAYTDVLVPVYCIDNASPYILKNQQTSTVKMWEAARSSSASPTYFPAYYQKELAVHFVDGGLWANNPSALVTGHLLREFDADIKSLSLLSLGTGYTVASSSIPVDSGMMNSAGPIINTLFQSSTMSVHTSIQQILSNSNYYRLNPELPIPISLDNIDKATQDCLNDMASSEENYKIIQNFYETRVRLRLEALESN